MTVVWQAFVITNHSPSLNNQFLKHYKSTMGKWPTVIDYHRLSLTSHRKRFGSHIGLTLWSHDLGWLVGCTRTTGCTAWLSYQPDQQFPLRSSAQRLWAAGCGWHDKHGEKIPLTWREHSWYPQKGGLDCWNYYSWMAGNLQWILLHVHLRKFRYQISGFRQTHICKYPGSILVDVLPFLAYFAMDQHFAPIFCAEPPMKYHVSTGTKTPRWSHFISVSQ